LEEAMDLSQDRPILELELWDYPKALRYSKNVEEEVVHNSGFVKFCCVLYTGADELGM
jgi:hypothetical protein